MNDNLSNSAVTYSEQYYSTIVSFAWLIHTCLRTDSYVMLTNWGK